jgi:uncharacterized protein (TIGR02466 family)
MDYKIIDIFPTAVMKFKLGKNLNKAEIDFVNLHESKHYQNAGNTYSRNTFILNEDEMKHISEFCNNSLQMYFEKVINPLTDTNIKITQSWLNYTNTKGFHHEHDHPNSIISGVFYFSADKEKDIIAFNRLPSNKQIQIFYKEANDYNTIQTDIKVETGDLVLFPSYIPHFVPPVESSKKRISLAFNSFVYGELGLPQALNYVKI